MSELQSDFKEENAKTENKLLLIYLIDKMDIPLSNSFISQFTLEENLMSYFELQQSLADLVQSGYLEKIQENNTIRYLVTDEGLVTLEYLEKHIPDYTRAKVNKFVSENRKSVKKEYEVTSNYFYDHANNEFIVKCGVYEDENMLMEINLSVVTRDQARLICKNWKQNINNLYGNIISELVTAEEKNAEGSSSIEVQAES